MTVKDLKKEFKLRNATAKTIENILTVPFIVCLILALVKFSGMWLIAAIVFAIVQSILYSMNKSRWKVFLMDNKDKLDEEEKSKLKL